MPLLLIIVYLMLFDPFFGMPNGIGALIGSMLSLAYLFKGSIHFKNWNKILLLYISSFVVFTGVLILVAGGQLSFLFTLVKVGIVGYCSWVFFNHLNGVLIEKYWTAFSIVWIFQAGYIILCFFIPEIRDAAKILRPPESSHIYDAIVREGTLIRLWPASGQLISGLAAICSAAFIALFIHVIKKPSAIGSLGLMSIIVVGLSSGRIFYIALLLSLIFGCYIAFRRTSMVLFAVTFFILIVYSYLNYFNESLASWMFEPFIKYFQGDGFRTSSSDSLISNHLFLPDIYSILVPSFEYKSADVFSAGTDSGFIRYMLFGGPLFFTTFFFMFFLLVLKFKSFLGILLSFVLLFIISVKQETLTNASFVFSLIMLTWTVKIYEKKNS